MSTTSTASIEAEVASLRALVAEQGDVVRKLKENGATKQELAKAVAELKTRKAALDEKEKTLAPPEVAFNRAPFEDLMKRRFFWTPSFQIYGGVSGLYDYGPTGCAIKANVLNMWRSHFVLEESMLEVDCSMLTVESVLKASGHVARFTDLMVHDLKDKTQCFRADHLLEAHLEKKLQEKGVDAALAAEYNKVLVEMDNYSKTELGALMKKYGVKAPETGNDISDPEEFNLMFATSIGPSGLIKGYLRPETAQGIFVNFKKLLNYNNDRLPFAAAQIGSSFRNEISPRAGLLRVREFTMAEIEHFVHPNKKQHPKFASIADLKIQLYSREEQLNGNNPVRVSLGDAVKKGTIANETLAYFIGRIYLFLTKVGVKDEKLRFRQHLPNEMAHYASDCWDAECKSSYGWVECVGCADRSAYDLLQHSEASGTTLTANENLEKPKIIDFIDIVYDKSVFGKTYKKDAEAIIKYLTDLQQNNPCRLEELAAELTKNNSISLSLAVALDEKGKIARVTPSTEADAKKFEVSGQLLQLKPAKKEVHVEEFTPHVIEPSFGIGRIIYSLLEQNFWAREGDEQRVVVSLPPSVAPVKCSVLPLSNNKEFESFTRSIAEKLTAADISHRVDESSVSIGRRYARTDEIAIPFGITVDFETVKNQTVTLRERDSTKQVRATIDEAVDAVKQIVSGKSTWADIASKFPAFEQQQA